MIFIAPLSTSVNQNFPSSNHVIMAKGYYQKDTTYTVDGISKTDTLRYVIANDPWKKCTRGNETLLPYAAFTDDSLQYTTPNGRYLVNRVLAVVHTIHPNTPKNYMDCLACDVLTGAYGTNSFVDTATATRSAILDSFVTNSIRTRSLLEEDLIAICKATPTFGPAPLRVSFDASGSVGNIKLFTYDFGDGGSFQTPERQTVNHTYESSGTYRVILTVYDSQTDTTDRDTVIIRVLPVSPPEDFKLIDVLLQNAEKVIGFNKNVLTRTEYRTQLQRGGYLDAQVQYLSFDKLNKSRLLALFSLCRLSRVVIPDQEIIEVATTTVQPNLVSLLQRVKTDSSLALRNISNYTALKERITVTINGGAASGSTVVLSNLPVGSAPSNAVKYSLIKYPPFQYEFYSFQLSGTNSKRTYLVPAADYTELNLQESGAYRQKRVLNALAQITRTYARINKIPIRSIL